MKKHRTVIEHLARAGYTSRGIVYLIIGIFALLAAIGAGENKDSEGALQNLLSQPFGTILVALMIVGLIGYAMWRLIQSLADADDHGTSAKGLAVRAGLLTSAVVYSTLALFAISQIGLFSGGGGGGSGSGGGFAQTMTSFVGARPVALILAAIFLIVGGAHLWKAVKMKFEEHFVAQESTMKVLRPIAVSGLIARGMVFFILAFLLFYRGAEAGENGSSPPNIKDAMSFLQGLPMGSVLLGAMGIGIILFAVYSFCEAIWRRVNVGEAL
ncbi:DUF1206 domain-containing protein [Pseudohoeflea coraliihabitans]|uniref:DUF1206 domain-containing protein n=1 Tax=Pseudohoeflea coraliihabitans TaxID=2860393 RepID=A0ABS6WQI6_9HYPH|nr:DUF1206 domain-containing protein [Pseudohoeflea sp. DP4N28-3]